MKGINSVYKASRQVCLEGNDQNAVVQGKAGGFILVKYGSHMI